MTTESVNETPKDKGSSLTLKTQKGVYTVTSEFDQFESTEDFCVELLVPLAEKLNIGLKELVKELFYEQNNTK